MNINTLLSHYQDQIHSISYLLLFVNALLHFLFASAVARDCGQIVRLGQQPALVSAATWAFATLVGGVFTAAIYWFIHHSTLTRPTLALHQ